MGQTTLSAAQVDLRRVPLNGFRNKVLDSTYELSAWQSDPKIQTFFSKEFRQGRHEDATREDTDLKEDKSSIA